MSAEPRRPDPDALAAAALREGRPALKIFLGAAPGVGKTFEMLNQARRRQRDGVDVVAGIIETHGRRETEQQIGDLPVLPRRSMTYTGPNGTQQLQEFDLDAALARRPALLLIDELAHTNVEGSRHRKRWEDVAELLAAGIPVWATLNVQHLESLNDSITRITGIRVTETLPDSVLDLAEEIELIDVPPKELRTRLREGRIYRADMATRALDGFFREGNLAALREIALRRAAQHVDANVLDYMRLNAIPGPWPASERVLALIGPASGELVVRHAKQLADALRGQLVALHVESPGKGDGTTAAALALAADLGAAIESRAGEDIVATTLELAGSRNVTQIVIGRGVGRGTALRRLTGRSLAATLLRRAPDYALHVVPAPSAATAERRRHRFASSEERANWLGWTIPPSLVAAVTAVGEIFSHWLEHEALGMLFLAVAVASATLYGLRAALLGATLGFLAWNFFFIPPLYRLTIYEPRDVIALLVFAGVAVSTGLMASRLHGAARSAQSRIEGLRQVGAFSRALGGPTTEAALYDEIVRHAAPIAGEAILLTGGEDTLDIRAAEPPADTLDEGSWAAAHWAYRRGEATGSFTATLPSSPWRFLPIRIARPNPVAGNDGNPHLLGLLGLRSPQRLPAPALQALEALADQAAVALERVHLANAAARDVAMMETQKLRTALLNSLSHDLRTPLTGIRGSAETLRTAWSALTPAIRIDLLAAIEDDTGRMTRFLDNITDMTRLESGEIVPMLVPLDLDEIVQAAIGRLRRPAVETRIEIAPDLPQVIADPALLEQVLFNILDNSVKYAVGQPSIRITAKLNEQTVNLSIDDSGIGIAAEDLPHVFDSFYRAQRGDRVAPGTGLGLAIARGLIEAMAGRIDAGSPRSGLLPGEPPGTVITLFLPACLQVARP